MTQSQSGGGDPELTMRLLWRTGATTDAKPARGRRPRVSVDQIVEVAIAAADLHGLETMTMQKVARELSVGTMTLYTHVPGKAELIDLMVDAAWGELDLPVSDPDERNEGSDWRARVVLYADRVRDLYRRHPWLREISTVRPPLGPGLLARQEYLLRVLMDAGLDACNADAAAAAITTFVDASAAAEAARTHAEDETGQSELAWWEARQATWEQLFDPTRYPVISNAWQQGALVRSGAEAARSARHLGLQWLMDGIDISIKAAG